MINVGTSIAYTHHKVHDPPNIIQNIRAHTLCYNILMISGTQRKNIKPGTEVDIVLKKDQTTGKLTHGVVKNILTSKANHPRGIKVRLESGSVGRVQSIYLNGVEHKNPPHESKRRQTGNSQSNAEAEDFDNFI